MRRRGGAFGRRGCGSPGRRRNRVTRRRSARSTAESWSRDAAFDVAAALTGACGPPRSPAGSPRTTAARRPQRAVATGQRCRRDPRRSCTGVDPERHLERARGDRLDQVHRGSIPPALDSRTPGTDFSPRTTTTRGRAGRIWRTPRGPTPRRHGSSRRGPPRREHRAADAPIRPRGPTARQGGSAGVPRWCRTRRR